MHAQALAAVSLHKQQTKQGQARRYLKESTNEAVMLLRVLVVHHRRVQSVLYSNVPVLRIPGAVAGAED